MTKQKFENPKKKSEISAIRALRNFFKNNFKSKITVNFTRKQTIQLINVIDKIKSIREILNFAMLY